MPYSGQIKEVQIPDGTIWEIPGGGGGGSVDPATATPLMDGTGAVGTSAKYAREDHVHPSDTSRQETLVSGTNIKTVNGNSLLGSGDLTTPNTMRDPATNAPPMDGTAAVGTSVKYAREDHVHPSDTSKQNVLTAGTGISIVGDTISTTVHGIEHLEDSSNASGLRQINSAAEDSSYSVGSDAAVFGSSTKASGDSSFAEGYSTTASNSFAHAEGSNTTASGISSHAEGAGNVASGLASHAEGNGARAIGEQSHAQNLGTIAQGLGQTAIGKYNVAQGSQYSANPTDYAFIIGNGADDQNRSNAFAVYWDGRATLGADPSANMDAVTKQYLDNAISGASYTAGKQLTLTGNEFSLSANPDTRNTNENPQWYMTNYPRRNVVEFKNSNAIGLGTSQTYCALRTYVPWSDSSGSYPVQFATIGNTLYMRIGTSDTAWGSWVNVTANTTYSAGTGISISGTTITATGVKDDNSTNEITFSYNKAGLTSTSWFAAWNGYELRAINPANALTTLIGAMGDKTGSVSAATNTYVTALNTGSLAAGTYLFTVYADMGGTGTRANRRMLMFTTASGSNTPVAGTAMWIGGNPNGSTSITYSFLLAHTSATTYYLRCLQQTGETQTISGRVRWLKLR